MSGEDIARISESFRIRGAGFEAAGLPAIICAAGLLILARAFADLIRNNPDAALRGLVFSRSPGRGAQAEQTTEARTRSAFS